MPGLITARPLKKEYKVEQQQQERLFGLRVGYEMVSIDKVIFNPHNLRGFLRSPEQIARIAYSIRKDGLLNNPIVSFTVNGILAVAGEQRLLSHRYLVNEGYQEYTRVFCKVLEGVSDEVAMRILAVENANQGTQVPIATANEVYWHYQMSFREVQHVEALRSVQGIWANGKYAYDALVVPGWLIYHAPTIQTLIGVVGGDRADLGNAYVQETSAKLRRIPLAWWRMIAWPFKPMEHRELLDAPSDTVQNAFDELLRQCLSLVERGEKGERALMELESRALPIRERRILRALEDREERGERGSNVSALHRELRNVRDRIRKRRTG